MPPLDPPSTIEQLLNVIANRFDDASLFYGHGTDNAWDEAVMLVLHVLQLPMDSSSEVAAQPVTLSQRQACETLMQQRIDTQKPLAYLIHRAWFMGLEFYVDERVIVPRSPFAEWIDQQFMPWVEPASVTRVLDLCTGSGCMAIAAALRFPDAHVTAIDIDADALAVAKRNVDAHQLAQRVSLVQSDGLDGLSSADTFDLIMANPPYVSTEEMSTLPQEYHHEPRHALAAYQHGLGLVLRWLSQITDYLSPSGYVFMEVGNTDETLQAWFPEVPFTWLEQACGGHGIFMLHYDDLVRYQSVFENHLN